VGRECLQAFHKEAKGISLNLLPSVGEGGNLAKDRELYEAALAACREYEGVARSHPLFSQTKTTERWCVWHQTENGQKGEGRDRIIHSTFRLFERFEDKEPSPAVSRLVEVVKARRKCSTEDALVPSYAIIRRTVFLFPLAGDGVLERFEELYPEFETDVLAPAGKQYIRTYAPLLNVDLTSPRVALRNGVTIEKCDDRAYRNLQESTSFVPSLGDRLAEHASHIVTHEELADFPGKVFPPDGWGWEFEQLCLFGKLFKKSGFYISAFKTPSSSLRKYGGTVFRPSPFLLPDRSFPHAPGEILRLSIEEEAHFVSAHERFIKYCPVGPFPLFLRRFAKGCHELDPEERILDLTIAVEGLVLKNDRRGELSGRLAMRIAWLLGKNVRERKALQEQAQSLYSLRSRIAHGNELDLTVPQLTQKADELEDLARRVIWAEIDAKVSTGTGVDWANLAFGKD
jgi:hypothetical protein